MMLERPQPSAQTNNRVETIVPEEVQHKELYSNPYELPKKTREALTKEQRQVINSLTRASARLADLYGLQESMEFYPSKLSTNELREAGESNPQLLSPYTYVRRDESGTLVAIPFHEVFRKEITDKRIVETLKEAAKMAGKGKKRDKQLQEYLQLRAQSFLDGSWEKADIAWLNMKTQPEVFAIIGPYDNYLDSKKIKYAFQSWVGVLDREETANAQELCDQFLEWWGRDSLITIPKVHVRVEHNRMISGQAAKYEWTGNSLPCQPELREKYGSIFTIFEPVFMDKFNEHRKTAFRSIVDPAKRSGVTDENLKRANKNRYILHEVSHSLVAKDVNQRLGDQSAWIKEIYCDLVSIKGSASLAKSKKDSELAFATYFANGRLEYSAYTDDNTRSEYYVGNSIALNYCIKNGSINIHDGYLAWDDSDAVIKDLSNLLDSVDRIQKSGTAPEAFDLSEAHFAPDVYAALRVKTEIPSYLRKRPRS